MSARVGALQLVRFGISGLLTNAAYFAALFSLLWLDVAVELAGAVAYALSMLVNFQLQARFTFRSQRSPLQALLPYLVTHGVAMALNSLLLHVCVTRLQWHILAGQGIALVVVTCWTFLSLKLWVFRGPRGS